ncbi:hypothetical protein [uncultured Cedecea sp.]|uniref:hypothetical protein n=1 Tax=uncultured Cedecea sp. TaxID=988762 RepID=UPI002638504F|nr:hypothetical protein [uncultured Cedecea sp.]
MSTDDKMYSDERIALLFSQTGNLLSGYLAANPKETPEYVIRDMFETTYKALQTEFNKSYIKK